MAGVAATGSRELFTLSILAIGMGVAYGAGVIFGVSFALGAFFAGMMLKESELSAQAAADTLPLRDAFAVLFFVSVGMLFNPAILVEQPLQATAADHVIVVGFGRVGKRVASTLTGAGAAVVVVEADLERAQDIRRQGGVAIHGNATNPEVLKAAGVESARHLIVAAPNSLEAGEIVARARAINPALRIVARANLDAEMEHILAKGANRVVMGEREIARLMVADVAQAPAT